MKIITFIMTCRSTGRLIRVGPDESVIVGRIADVCDISLDGPGVSRQQFRLTHYEGRLTLQDLNPRQLMRLNKKFIPFKSSCDLSPGDRLEFSVYDFLV